MDGNQSNNGNQKAVTGRVGQRKVPGICTLFVGNMNRLTTLSQLIRFFETNANQPGPPISIYDARKISSSMYGWVELDKPERDLKAALNLDGKLLLNKCLRIKIHDQSIKEFEHIVTGVKPLICKIVVGKLHPNTAISEIRSLLKEHNIPSREIIKQPKQNHAIVELNDPQVNLGLALALNGSKIKGRNITCKLASESHEEFKHLLPKEEKETPAETTPAAAATETVEKTEVVVEKMDETTVQDTKSTKTKEEPVPRNERLFCQLCNSNYAFTTDTHNHSMQHLLNEKLEKNSVPPIYVHQKKIQEMVNAANTPDDPIVGTNKLQPFVYGETTETFCVKFACNLCNINKKDSPELIELDSLIEHLKSAKHRAKFIRLNNNKAVIHAVERAVQLNDETTFLKEAEKYVKEHPDQFYGATRRINAKYNIVNAEVTKLRTEWQKVIETEAYKKKFANTSAIENSPEVSETAYVQELLDASKQRLYGVSYVLEQRFQDDVNMYRCTLCQQDIGPERLDVRYHLLNIKHRLEYMKRHHPEQFKKITSVKKGTVEEVVKDAMVAKLVPQLFEEILTDTKNLPKGKVKVRNVAMKYIAPVAAKKRPSTEQNTNQGPAAKKPAVATPSGGKSDKSEPAKKTEEDKSKSVAKNDKNGSQKKPSGNQTASQKKNLNNAGNSKKNGGNLTAGPNKNQKNVDNSNNSGQNKSNDQKKNDNRNNQDRRGGRNEQKGNNNQKGNGGRGANNSREHSQSRQPRSSQDRGRNSPRNGANVRGGSANARGGSANTRGGNANARGGSANVRDRSGIRDERRGNLGRGQKNERRSGERTGNRFEQQSRWSQDDSQRSAPGLLNWPTSGLDPPFNMFKTNAADFPLGGSAGRQNQFSRDLMNEPDFRMRDQQMDVDRVRSGNRFLDSDKLLSNRFDSPRLFSEFDLQKNSAGRPDYRDEADRFMNQMRSGGSLNQDNRTADTVDRFTTEADKYGRVDARDNNWNSSGRGGADDFRSRSENQDSRFRNDDQYRFRDRPEESLNVDSSFRNQFDNSMRGDDNYFNKGNDNSRMGDNSRLTLDDLYGSRRNEFRQDESRFASSSSGTQPVRVESGHDDKWYDANYGSKRSTDERVNVQRDERVNTQRAERGFRDERMNTQRDERGFRDERMNTHQDERGFRDERMNTQQDERGFRDERMNTQQDERGFRDERASTQRDDRGYRDERVNAQRDERDFYDPYRPTGDERRQDDWRTDQRRDLDSSYDAKRWERGQQESSREQPQVSAVVWANDAGRSGGNQNEGSHWERGRQDSSRELREQWEPQGSGWANDAGRLGGKQNEAPVPVQSPYSSTPIFPITGMVPSPVPAPNPLTQAMMMAQQRQQMSYFANFANTQ